MATFAERLSKVMGPDGYDVCMRRSVQTAVLYEAKRCLSERLPGLRIFQRKIALYDMANYLVQSLPLSDQTKEEVMYRTATSRESLNSDTAWKRMKLITRELDKVVTRIKPHLVEGRSFDDACEAFVQEQYEAVSGTKGKNHPRHWEHTHNNVFMTYRMYYRGEGLDPSLPPPKPPKQIVVPSERPKTGKDTTFLMVNQGGTTATTAPARDPDINEVELEAIVNPGAAAGESATDNARRVLLKEVREHLDILKEFEGVIPAEELNKRKRDLFLALPSAPPAGTAGIFSPSSGKKKARTGEAVTAMGI